MNSSSRRFSCAPAVIGADSTVGFGDAGPDTDWLSGHERNARAAGQTLRADALAWLIAEFDLRVVLFPGATAVDVDPDVRPRVCAVVGSYRFFEFAAAREERRAHRGAVLTEHRLIREHGFAYSAGYSDQNPTYDKVAADEIPACMGNFLGVVGYAPEFDAAPALSRWTDTVDSDVPEELQEFTAEYLATLRAIEELPASHTEALQAYSRALAAVYSAPTAQFEAAAGRAHAWHVVLRDERCRSVPEAQAAARD